MSAPAVSPNVTLRMAGPEDERALARLAELDDAPPLVAPILLAEVRGSPSAALSLSDLRTVANPFERTAALVELLIFRATGLCDRPTVAWVRDAVPGVAWSEKRRRMTLFRPGSALRWFRASRAFRSL